MIPAAVAILTRPGGWATLAAADDPSDWFVTASADVAHGIERLSPLPIQRLVPDARPGTVSTFEHIDPEQLVPGLRSRADGLSLKAGIYQIYDFLDASHDLAQSAERAGANTTAPYWHGIVHRREPDYDNAAYWFQRVGRHTILPDVGREAAALLADPEFADRLRFPRVLDHRGHWSPLAFIDLCRECGTFWDERAQAAARLQEIEMRLLLEYTCRATAGNNHA